MTAAATTKTHSPDQRSHLALYNVLATGLVPEWLIRVGIRTMLDRKLSELRVDRPETLIERMQSFKEELETYPIAVETDSANNQHYEVPTEFFQEILGPRMKYSCALWDDATNLADAEDAMLEVTCTRAELRDGQTILELGCGWGSFTLYAAAKYPNSRITAVSNSRTQRQFIEKLAAERQLPNVNVITCDINDLSLQEKFDRVVSVEMFEHCKNYKLLLSNIAGWLTEDGKLFVHIFTHVVHQYHYGVTDDDWLAKYFFTGGTMPSDNLLTLFRDHLSVSRQWRVNGVHYQKTSEAWLENMQLHRARVERILESTYGAGQMRRWWVYWRLFFLACAELWGYSDGNEWMVSHYLFAKTKSAQP